MKWDLSVSDHVSGPANTIKANLEGVAKAFELINKAEAALNQSKATAALASKSKTDLSRFQSEAASMANLASHAGLTSVEAQLGAKLPSLFAKITQGIGSFFGEQGVSSFLDVAGAAGKADTALASVGMSLGGVVAGGAAIAVAGIALVALGLYEVVSAAGQVAIALSKAFVSQTISTGIFRENSLVGLEVMLKSRDKAAKVYADAVEMAAKTPFETTDVIPLFQKLLAAGFKEDELKSVATSIGDMAASKGMDKQVMDRLVMAFGRLKSGKGLTTEVLNMFTENGVSRTEVVAELSKVMKKSADEVEKLLSTGKISSDIAQTALLSVVNNKFGGTMDKMSRALSGLWSTLVSRPFDIFNKALENKDGGIAKFYEVIKDTVKYFGDAFDPKSNASGKFIAVLDVIGNTFANIAKIASAFGTGLFDGFAQAMPDLSKTKGADVQNIATAFGILGEAIGKTLGFMITAGTTIATFIANHKTLLQVITVLAVVVGAVFFVLAASIVVVLGTISAALIWIGGTIAAVFLALPVAIVAAVGTITSAVVAAFGYAVYWVISSIDQIGAAIGSIVGTVAGLYGSLYAAATTLGAGITAGILAGLDSSAIGAAIGAVVPGYGIYRAVSGASSGGGGSSNKAAEMAVKSMMPSNSELGLAPSGNGANQSYDNSKSSSNSVSIIFQAGSIIANDVEDFAMKFERHMRSKNIMIGNA